MPTLIKAASNGWAVTPEPTQVQWQTPEDWRSGQPLLLSADIEPLPEFSKAERIAIEFPAFNDGRALSLAVLLRTRL